MLPEHVAPQFSRSAFSKIVRARNSDLPDGVTYSVGLDSKGNASAVQSVHFDAKKWAPAEARGWLQAHRFTKLAFIAARDDISPEEQADDAARVSLKFDIEVVSKQEDKQRVFGWLYVCRRKDGSPVVDHSGEIITIDELEEATYGHVLDHRKGGAAHEYDGEGPETVKQVSRLCECMVFTPWKKKDMGIPDGVLPDGTWIGTQVDDHDTWLRYKSGEFRMFSLGGYAIRRAIENAKRKAAELARLAATNPTNTGSNQ
jgi:hypothetical protein